MGQLLSTRPRPQTSVIIPTLNEESTLGATLHQLHAHKTAHIQVIVADAYSSDGTVAIARAHAATVLRIAGGRAAQQNAAVLRHATAETLLFLHADTHVPPRYDAIIAATLSPAPPRSASATETKGRHRGHHRRPLPIAGAFSLAVSPPPSPALRLVTRVANWRARVLQRPYGDQGLFLKRATFDAVGGFLPLPFLDDYELVLRLSRRGRIAIVAPPVHTSDRRWRALGVVHTTLLNQFIIAAYHVGVPVPTLHAWYRGAFLRAQRKRQSNLSTPG